MLYFALKTSGKSINFPQNGSENSYLTTTSIINSYIYKTKHFLKIYMPQSVIFKTPPPASVIAQHHKI